MESEKITVKTIVDANVNKVWEYYTQPEHITKWNFADPSWHCPTASNNMRVGGKYIARMEAKDGSFGFDFEAEYTDIQEPSNFTYEFGGRTSTVEFNERNDATEIIITFDAERENSIEMQRAGWQAILDNFKNYTENN